MDKIVTKPSKADAVDAAFCIMRDAADDVFDLHAMVAMLTAGIVLTDADFFGYSVEQATDYMHKSINEAINIKLKVGDYGNDV